MPQDAALDWVLALHEEHGTKLYRLATMLGAGEHAEEIVRDALLTLHRRGRRIVDPQEREEFLPEHVVHVVRPLGRDVSIPSVEDESDVQLLETVGALPRHMAEILVVSHYLGTFGPQLARVMRMTVRGANQRLEIALETLRARLQTDQMQEALSQDLSDALRAAATQIRVPSWEGLPEELAERVEPAVRDHVRGQFVVVAAIVAMALGAGVAAMTSGDPELPPVPLPSAPASSPATQAPVAIRAVVKQVPVYYVGRGDSRLYRELRNLPSTGDLARSAIDAVFTLAPLDPDYSSLWAGDIREVRLEGDVLNVDLAPATYEAIEPEMVQAAIDQMVYTTADALGNSDLKIRFLSDGLPAPGPFGASDTIGRRGLDPMPGLWINSPRNQDQAPAGTLTITGTIKPGHDAPVVTITDTKTRNQVAHTVAQTMLLVNPEGWQEWSMSVSLPEAGTYEIVANAQGNDGRAASENKIINVA